MRISVVILNWNRPQDALLATASVLRQDYSDYDVLVWDNASSDSSKEILEAEYRDEPRVALHFADQNYGVAGGRNRAFRAARGDVLLSLDSDAVFEGTDSLSIIAQRLQSNPRTGAVSFEVKRPDGHLMWPFARPSSAWRHRTFETTRVDGCAFAVRREAFLEADGFAEHFSPYGAEDQHFAFKLVGLGYEITYLPEVVIVHAFADHGRTGLQFRRHVRNSLWIPMELFPLPQAILRAGKSALDLFREALEQHQVLEYTHGALEACFGFRPNRRRPMGPNWQRFKHLVREEKRLAESRGAERRGP